MVEKKIPLLKNQIKKPDEKKSDLETWKNYSIILVARIFGEGNMRIKMVRDLNYDYSSWNLLDSTGICKTFNPVKMQTREILEPIIAEPEIPGTPVKKSKKKAALRIVEEELTGRQIKEIETILHSEENAKEEKIGRILINLEKEKLISLISRILLD